MKTDTRKSVSTKQCRYEWSLYANYCFGELVHRKELVIVCAFYPRKLLNHSKIAFCCFVARSRMNRVRSEEMSSIRSVPMLNIVEFCVVTTGTASALLLSGQNGLLRHHILGPGYPGLPWHLHGTPR